MHSKEWALEGVAVSGKAISVLTEHFHAGKDVFIRALVGVDGRMDLKVASELVWRFCVDLEGQKCLLEKPAHDRRDWLRRYLIDHAQW